MKKALGLVLAAFFFTSTANAATFYYTSGSLTGQVVDHTGYLGYMEACYTGNPWKARAILKSMAFDDYEKTDVTVWFNQTTHQLEVSYVDTKCLDDSLDATPEGCRSEVVIPACL